ncbi:hypothetical protein BH18THE1_BH18THE1_22790 [soil metagenome]
MNLISCDSKKGTTKVKVKDLYKGPLFANSLLDLDEELEPYDVTLSYVTPDNKLKSQI